MPSLSAGEWHACLGREAVDVKHLGDEVLELQERCETLMKRKSRL